MNTSVDYAVFALPEFDANEYANAVLAGETYPVQQGKARPTKNTSFAPANEDISVAISELNFSIDDVDKQLKNVVSVSGSFASVRQSRSPLCIDFCR